MDNINSCLTQKMRRYYSKKYGERERDIVALPTAKWSFI